ncbi:MAG: Anion-transporting ATPase [Frankiales bacterium]|jgi:anion-transporting  ArsA/GET3 family ATPase|nr:Anion-transporting ATPase [Frankiales bacterium]
MSDFPAARLHVVSGKGGTGKTTVSAALALALAAGGRKVLLMEVEGRQGLAQLFDSPPLPYEERKVAVAQGGGDVYALAVDAEQALLDYLHMFYKLSPNGLPARTLRKIGAIDFATTIAPGIRDVLLTGKVKEVTTRAGSRGGRYYDAVVVDAPPTGRIPRFLNITHEVGNLTKVGPLKAQSDGVMAVFKSPQTVVHLVTLLEEMPVQETVEAIEELTALGLPVGGVVVNMVRAPFLSPEDVAAVAAGTAGPRLKTGLKAAAVDPALAPVLLREAAEHAARVALEERGHDALAHLQRPTYELPLLPDAVDLGGLYELATALKAQGMA